MFSRDTSQTQHYFQKTLTYCEDYHTHCYVLLISDTTWLAYISFHFMHFSNIKDSWFLHCMMKELKSNTKESIHIHAEPSWVTIHATDMPSNKSFLNKPYKSREETTVYFWFSPTNMCAAETANSRSKLATSKNCSDYKFKQQGCSRTRVCVLKQWQKFIKSTYTQCRVVYVPLS